MKSYQKFMFSAHKISTTFCAPFPNRISHFKILAMPKVHVSVSQPFSCRDPQIFAAHLNKNFNVIITMSVG